MGRSPADIVADLEARPPAPTGPGEVFVGYGVMGLAFSSGHLLALRRFVASSVGPAYRAVWHRNPHGRWAFFQDVPHDQGCMRYFGDDVERMLPATIDLAWLSPYTLSITADAGELSLRWRVTLGSTTSTRAMNGLSTAMPKAWWRNPSMLTAMGATAGPLLHVGRVRLTGRVPNGQRFLANPRQVWRVAASTALLDSADLGPIGPAPVPGALGDFCLPQRGVFAIGRTVFQPPPSKPG